MPGLLVLLMMTIEGMAFVALLVMLAVVAFVALTMLLVMLAVVAFVALLVMLAVVAFVMLLMMFTGLSRQRMAQTIKQTHHCPPRRFGVTHERQALLSAATPSTPPVPAHKQITRVSANAYWEYTPCIIPCWGDDGWTARGQRVTVMEGQW